MSNSTAPRRRPKNQYLPWLRFFVKLFVVVAVLIIGFLVWNNWDKLAPEAVLDWAETRFGDAQIGNGFPTTIEGNSVLAMGEVNQHLVTLSDTALQFYNSSATRVVTRNHSFSDPTMHTAGRYALVTEIGASRFRLDTRRGTVLSMELENRKIYASCVLSSGMVGVITDSPSQSYLCEIQVYNRHGKCIFTHQSRKYLLTNISLATDGKGIAAVGTTAENGMLKSVLLIYKFSDSEPVEYSGSDLLLYDVNYYANDAVLAIGDKEIWMLPPRGRTVEKIPLDGYEPIGYTASTTLSALVLQRAGSTGDGYVWTIDSSGTVWKSQQLEGAFRSVSCQGSKILVLTESRLYTFVKGDLQQEAQTPSDSLLVTEYRDLPLLLTLSELQRVES